MMALRPLPLARSAVAAAGLLCCLLAGCTLGPDYKRPTAELPEVWRNDAGTADLTNSAWWENFGDAQLTHLIQTALQANRDLHIATHRVEEYDAKLEVAASEKYPHAGYKADFQRIHRSQELPELLRPGAPVSYNSYSTGINISWETDLWGRVRRSNEAARAGLLSSEEARRGVMLTVVAGVASGYIELLGLDKQLALAQQTKKNREDELGLLTKKQQGGSATRLQVERARSLLDEINAGIPQIERQIAAAENALSVLVGRNPGPIARGQIDAIKLPPVPQGLPSDLLARRPDILAAEQDMVAANARIGIAKTEYFPSISLTGLLGLASDDLLWLGAKTARTGEINRTIIGTIFSAGQIEGDIRQAEAVHKQTLERYLKAIQTSLQEVEDALVFRAKSAQRLTALQRRVSSLQEVARLTRLRYEGGESTLQDVLNADREVFAAQNQLAEGRRDEFQSLVALYKAMGGGWMDEQDKQRAARLASADAGSAPVTPAVEAQK